jgi:threonine dehydratase
MLAARDALNLKTRVVGVVSAHASAYAQSFEARRAIESPVTTKLSDGMACRVPEPAALELILEGVERIVQVTDEEVSAAMRMMFECTHNVCEGAGAAALAAATQEKAQLAGLKVAVIASGGNIDQDVFANVLSNGKQIEE